MPNETLPRETGPAEAAPRRDWPGMAAAVIFILLGLWVLRQSQSMSALGSIFPQAIAGALIVFSVILLAVNLRSARGTAAPDEAVLARGPESTPRRLALVGIGAAWVLLLPVIGFLVTGMLAFLGVLAVANYDSWTPRRAVLYVAVSAVIVVAFYLLLVEVLLVPMPTGLLF